MYLYNQRTYILKVGVVPLIPKFGARCFEWSSNFTPLSLYSTERTQAIYSKRGLDGPQSRFGYFGDKYYAHTGKRTKVPRFSSALLFYYTDCAITVLTNTGCPGYRYTKIHAYVLVPKNFMKFMFSTVYRVTQKDFYARPYTSTWAPVVARQISKRYSSSCHVFISM